MCPYMYVADVIVSHWIFDVTVILRGLIDSLTPTPMSIPRRVDNAEVPVSDG